MKAAATWRQRVDALAWPAIVEELDSVGCAPTGLVIGEAECERSSACMATTRRFRSTVDMARQRFGKGEYRYFAQPLPDAVVALRDALWPHLPRGRSRMWYERLDRAAPWPDRLDDWLAACHAAGQRRPTPLLLRYGPGDWNALHRDLYGDLVFPLQVVVGLDEPGGDYTGGEFVVVEQRPRAQSRATVTTILAVTRSSSRHATGHCEQSEDGRQRPCGTAPAPCEPAGGTRSASSSTTRPDVPAEDRHARASPQLAMGTPTPWTTGAHRDDARRHDGLGRERQ